MNSSLALTVTNKAQSMTNYTFIAPSIAGSHLVTVRYPGDAMHSPSTTTSSVLVGNVVASGGFSLSAGNLTVANGGSGSTQVTITPTGGYNGRIVWSLTSSNSTGNLTACYSIASPVVNGTSTTKLTIGIGSNCSSSSPAERRNLRPVGPLASLKGENPSPWRRTPKIPVFASLLICGSLIQKWRTKRFALALAVTLLTVGSLSLTGCGGAKSSDGNGTSTGPPIAAANYTMTLTGTDSVNTFSVKASTTFSLTVN